ncbi:SIMPL domain-containing protein [bacterium]|nr:SIMPL domain-containing protein [bacterium]
MKKFLLLISAILIISQSSILAVPSETIAEQRGYISTSSEKTKEVYPNIAEVTFTKENTAKTIETASSENKAAMAEIYKALEKFNTNESDLIEIRTGSYTANPNYTYKNNKRIITGYTVINSITVKTKSTEKLGKMIDAAIKAGADKVGSLFFSYQNDGSICKELVYLATREAYDLATVAAKSANQSIKAVKSINTACYTQMNNSSNYRNFSMQMKAMSDVAEEFAEPETSVTPGKIKIKANVNAEFYVK